MQRVRVVALTFAGGAITSSHGGAITISGDLTVINCSFSGNTAGLTGGGGGAIHGRSDSIVTITNSTSSGNTAGFGGAIWSQGTLTVTNSAFTGNSAFANGGGALDLGGATTIVNSTFAGNSAPLGGSFYGGAANISNSILAAGSGPICANNVTINDGCYYLSTDASCGFAAAGSQQNVTAEQFALGTLGANGGPTQTILPRPSSIAVDRIPAGANCGPAVAPTDQRGRARPQHVRCDAGAVEVPYRLPPRLVGE